MSGWLKLHRKMLEWEWSSSPNHVALFITLMLRANFKESSYRGKKIMPGQLLTGRKQLALWSGLSEQQIRTVLKDLKNSGEINQQSTKTFSMITLTSWAAYQEDNQQPTINQPHPKNVKKERRKKEEGKPSPFSFLFPDDQEICAWLNSGKHGVQERLLKDYSHHVLVEEIKKAFVWRLGKNGKQGSDLFLATWLNNSKKFAYNPEPKKTLSDELGDFFKTYAPKEEIIDAELT